MTITWHGFSCFKIEEKLAGGEVSLMTDPFAPEDGKKLPRNASADVVTVSHDHPRHGNVKDVGGTPFIIDGPGEYEIKVVFVTGAPTFHDLEGGKEKGRNTMYYITVGDVHLVHLGDLKHPLEEKHMEELHNIDVLFVPVGGGDVLTAKQAVEVIGQLEPRIIIPMHYRAGGFGAKLDGVEPFLRAMGVAKPEAAARYKVSKKELPQEEFEKITLEQLRVLIRKYWSRHKTLLEWMNQVRRDVARDGYVETILGYRRYIDSPTSIQGQREAINAIPQGSAADLMRLSVIKLDESGMGYMFRNFIHDEIIVEVPEEKVDKCAFVMKKVCVGAMKLNVPIRVKIKIGSDFEKLK